MKPYVLPCLSLALLAAGLLLFFEVIRPFRELEIDVPVALTCWALGIVLPAVAMWRRQQLFAFNLVALILNAIVLGSVSALMYLVATSWRMF